MAIESNHPQSVRSLAADVDTLGGKVVQDGDRNRWFVSIPINYTGGAVRQLRIGNVGYYVQDNGRPLVSGVAKIRREIELRRRFIPTR